MKKFLVLIASAVLLFCASINANAQKTAVVIQYDQLNSDASMKQFRKADWPNQLEILNYLIRKADENYYNCKTIDDVYELREQMALIDRYYDMRKNPKKNSSIVFESDFRKLDRKISQLEAKYNGQKYRSESVKMGYSTKEEEDEK